MPAATKIAAEVGVNTYYFIQVHAFRKNHRNSPQRYSAPEMMNSICATF